MKTLRQEGRRAAARSGEPAPRSPGRIPRSLLPLATATAAVAITVMLLTARADRPLGETESGSPSGTSPHAIELASAWVPTARAPELAVRKSLERVIEGRFGPSVPWSGRSAGVRGLITRDGRPDPGARLSFAAGLNAGLEFACDAEGRFASAGLYPGLALVTVTCSGESVTRELLLSQSHREDFDLDFVTGPRITGRVLDKQGTPVPHAQISLDGQETQSDGNGWFAVEPQAAGDPLLIVEAPGFCAYKESLRARRLAEPLEIELAPGGQLALSLAPLANGDGGDDAELYLVPLIEPFSAGGHQASFPWHRLCPLRVPPGGALVIEGLPATRYEILAFHRSGLARAENVWVQADRPGQVSLQWESKRELACTITRDGEPVRGVEVSILYGNPFRATLRELGSARKLWRSRPIHILPGLGGASVRSDGDGHCQVTRWGDRLDPGYLVVTAGGLTITRLLAVDEEEITLDLADPIAASTTTAGRVATDGHDHWIATERKDADVLTEEPR